ncbi:hypothetical protein A9Q99_02875 [Gammaproteobacteria bacterium 45_16_T64]|nr:hypothetical protein A9Q99_02875 [Gammaproteobacteria bacterium 45_16_T64]
MKQFFDFFPVAIFVGIYFYTNDIILSTKFLVGASGVQLAIGLLVFKKVEKMHLYTFLVLAVMGGLTIALKDPIFIMWKPTVINWTFSMVILGSQFIGDRPIVQRLIEGLLKQAPDISLDVPQDKWRLLNITWVFFFIFLGAVNIYVAKNYEESTWVTFKLIGMTLFNLVFFAAQFAYLSRFMSELPETSETTEDNAAMTSATELDVTPNKSQEQE